MPLHRCVLLPGALLAAVFWAVPAHGYGGQSDSWLTWSSSTNVCGDARSFAARVERALGRSPARAAAEAHVSVTARLGGSSGGGVARWVGEVHLQGEDQQDLGSRTIDRRDPSCRPLIDALAVVTALALSDDGLVPPESEEDPQQSSLAGASPLPESPSPSPADVPLAPPTPATPATPPPEQPPSPQRPAPVMASLSRSAPPPLVAASRGWRSGVQGGAKMGVGLLPGLAAGAELSAYLQTARGWKFFLALGGWNRQSSKDQLGRGASFLRFGGAVGVCPVTIARGRWDGAACASGEVGRLSVSGIGYPNASTHDRLTLDTGIGLDLARRIAGPVSAGVSLRASVPVFRDRITYTTTDGAVVSVFRESPVAAVGAFRLSVEL